jgi:hypothetical protein
MGKLDIKKFTWERWQGKLGKFSQFLPKICTHKNVTIIFILTTYKIIIVHEIFKNIFLEKKIIIIYHNNYFKNI